MARLTEARRFICLQAELGESHFRPSFLPFLDLFWNGCLGIGERKERKREEEKGTREFPFS
jgi:hypothetical protein